MLNTPMISNIGSLLKKEREKRKIPLEEIEKATRIRLKNLIAIEKEDWDQFPSRTYIQGIIKRYGAFLELDEQKLIAYFRRDYERHESIKFKQRTVKKQFTPQKKRLVQLAVALVILSFTGFFGYQVYLYMRPPTLTVLEPTATTFKRKDKVTLKGQAPAETVITVNGQEAFLDDNNIFEADIPLVNDKNPVIIVAIGANGKKTVIKKVFERAD